MSFIHFVRSFTFLLLAVSAIMGKSKYIEICIQTHESEVQLYHNPANTNHSSCQHEHDVEPGCSLDPEDHCYDIAVESSFSESILPMHQVMPDSNAKEYLSHSIFLEFSSTININSFSIPHPPNNKFLRKTQTISSLKTIVLII